MPDEVICSKRDESAVEPARAQKITFSPPVSLGYRKARRRGGGPVVEARPSPLGRPALAFNGGSAMADCADANLFEIIGFRQDALVELVVAQCSLVAFKPKPS